MIDFCLGLIRVSDSGDTNKRAKILSENRIQLQSIFIISKRTFKVSRSYREGSFLNLRS